MLGEILNQWSGRKGEPPLNNVRTFHQFNLDDFIAFYFLFAAPSSKDRVPKFPLDRLEHFALN